VRAVRYVHRVDDRESLTLPARGLIIYDGDCGFCTASVNRLVRHARSHPDYLPWQSLDLARYGLTPEQCQKRMYYTAPDGVVRGGAGAVAATLRNSSMPWPAAGVFLSLPGVRGIAEIVYRKIAANRYRMPGASASCALPAAPPASPGSEPPASI
jgi:predicted DCC family thiol-disulfide oxidoreductase YuxK